MESENHFRTLQWVCCYHFIKLAQNNPNGTSEWLLPLKPIAQSPPEHSSRSLSVCRMRQVNILHNDRVSTESEADSPRGFLDKSIFSWLNRNRKVFLFFLFKKKQKKSYTTEQLTKWRSRKIPYLEQLLVWDPCKVLAPEEAKRIRWTGCHSTRRLISHFHIIT